MRGTFLPGGCDTARREWNGLGARAVAAGKADRFRERFVAGRERAAVAGIEHAIRVLPDRPARIAAERRALHHRVDRLAPERVPVMAGAVEHDFVTANLTA